MNPAILVLLLAALHPLVYYNTFAGDAVIHLVYGENASRGLFFQFNPGEVSAGVTSPGYMLLLGALYKLLPAALVPLCVKLLDLVGWYSLCWIVYLVARRLLRRRETALVATAVASLLPGSAYNATIGMENGLFGMVVSLCVWLTLRWGLFEERPTGPAWADASLGLLLGLSCWLRPEGVVVAGLWFLCRLRFGWAGAMPARVLLARWSGAALIVAALVLGLVAFHYAGTGELLPTSGRSRVRMGSLDAIRLGPVVVTPKFAVRLLYYAPLSALGVLGSWLVVQGTRVRHGRPVGIFMVLVFWLFFVLYSTVLGSAHLGRYVIFTMPFLVILAALGGEWLWEHWDELAPSALRPFRSAAFVLLAGVLATVFVGESVQRSRLGDRNLLMIAVRAPEQRRQFSNDLLKRLGSPGGRPVVLAYQEIQVRYQLDERFLIRSLDGRVDPVLLDHVHDGYYDHPGYFRARNVGYVMGFPNYNRDPSAWALSRLKDLPPDGQEERDGLRFRRVGAQKIVAVEVLAD